MCHYVPDGCSYTWKNRVRRILNISNLHIPTPYTVSLFYCRVIGSSIVLCRLYIIPDRGMNTKLVGFMLVIQEEIFHIVRDSRFMRQRRDFSCDTEMHFMQHGDFMRHGRDFS